MSVNKIKYRPTVLIVVDGWGIAADTPGNAISRAKTPVMDKLISSYPTTVLMSYGDAVGLRWGEMGNSEVGHLNIGAGLVFYQNLPRINKEISRGEFYNNPALLKAAEHVKASNGKFHIMGLVSSGGVHSHIDHLFALLEFCSRSKIKTVYLHAFMDGRDAIYNSGKVFIDDVNKKSTELGIEVKIATMSGRYFSMDRDNRWDRTSSAYAAIVRGEAGVMTDKTPLEYLEENYAKEVYDEQIPPAVFTENGKPIAILEEGDSLIFFNFRSDRARQLTKAIAVPGFDKIDKKKEYKDLFFATMVDYEKDLPVELMYPPIIITQPLAKVISDAGLKQYHIAETEKYAHVTFFINGGTEAPFPGEDRQVIPSPKVTSYDQEPEMSAKGVTDDVLKKVQADEYDFYIMNYANPDMVAHTGNLKATIKAVEATDKQIGRVVEAVLARNGMVLITADHGNAEELMNLQTNDIDKEHSTNPVPFIIVANDLEGRNLGLPEGIGKDLSLAAPAGLLADVAPTILKLMDLPIPPEMSGTPLI